jgi:radical SAM superfamily enzyme YgiQ (UPF0313 family)
MPAWTVKEIYPPGTVRNQVSFQHPDGILCVAAYLKREGHDVRVLDGAFRTHEQILEEIRKFAADYVGIHSNTPLWNKAKRTAIDIKKVDPNIFVQVGGPFPIAHREKCLEECEAIDAVDIGEGELTAAELMQRLEKKEELDGMPGIVFRRRGNGEIVTNPPRPLIQDMDVLPFPAIELLEYKEKYVSPPGTYRRKPIINVHSSRGCVNDCIFCFQISANVEPKFSRKIRFRSPGHVVDEIEQRVNEFGYREVRFLDDNFIADFDRISAICDEIHRRKIDITWYCSSRVDIVSKEILKEMRRAGCWAILYGVETGVQKNLDTLRKRTTLDQIRQAVAWAKEAGIKVYTPFIFGIPGETYEEGLQSIDFAIELDPYIANFNTMTPLPGTDLYNNIEKYGRWEGDTDKTTFQHAAFVPHTMTREEIVRLRDIAFKKFYSRPKYMASRVFGIRTWDDVKMVAKGAVSLINIYRNPDAFDPDLIAKAPGDH